MMSKISAELVSSSRLMSSCAKRSIRSRLAETIRSASDSAQPNSISIRDGACWCRQFKTHVRSLAACFSGLEFGSPPGHRHDGFALPL
jgi:hypothetical protein